MSFNSLEQPKPSFRSLSLLGGLRAVVAIVVIVALSGCISDRRVITRPDTVAGDITGDQIDAAAPTDRSDSPDLSDDTGSAEVVGSDTTDALTDLESGDLADTDLDLDSAVDGSDQSQEVDSGLPPTVKTINSDTRSLEFKLSPDSKRIVYLQEVGNQAFSQINLISAPIEGGASVRLSHTEQAEFEHGIVDYSVTNSDTVFFLGDTELSKPVGLFTVSIGGGTITRLSALEQYPESFVAAPNGKHAVFIVDINGNLAAHRVTTTDPNPVLLGSESVLNDKTSYAITPDSLRVVHIGRSSLGPRRLVVTVLASGDQKTLYYDPNEQVESFKLNSSSTRVVFLVKQANGGQRLYSATLDGGSLNELSYGANVPFGSSDILSYQITPDGNRVVYVGDPEADAVFRLYTSSIAGAGHKALSENSQMNSALSVEPDLVRISADSQRVVFAGRLDSPGLLRLYSASFAGGEMLPLLPVEEPSLEVLPHRTKFVLQGNQLVFVGRVIKVEKLYTIPITGGALTLLSNHVVATGGDPLALPSDTSAAFFLHRAAFGAVQLFSVPIGGGTESVLSQNKSAADLDVQRFMLSPDGKFVVFAGDVESIGQIGLFSLQLK